MKGQGDGNQAEAAAVSETTTTAGRAAATTTGPFGARLALDAGDGVTAEWLPLCPKIVDVMVRRTDAACEPQYLPRATEKIMALIRKS
jgi:hypothetical protein